MLNRNALTMAVVAAVAASASVALADSKTPTLTLEPTVATLADAPAPRAPLMAGLDRLGAAKTLDDLKLNIYGWVEAGYTYNHQHQNRADSVSPDAPKVFSALNHEAGDNIMFNQLVLRFERNVDTSKVDVGGMVEIMYGEDAAGIHSNGLELGNVNGGTATNADTSENGGAGDRFHPKYQFDIVQAYVDIAVGVNGLKIRAGKMVSMFGYEYLNPNSNAFYSHSYIWQTQPVTHTGIMAFYQINDQWSVMGGFSRGWDQSLEDNNSCAIDVLGQIAYTPNKTWSAVLNFSSGPENAGDTGHYRTALNPILTWNVTDRFTLAAEGWYIYDGGVNAEDSGASHAYGDVWGAAVYASYVVNDYITINGRAEKLHTYNDFADSSDFDGVPGVVPINYYEATLGLTIKPFPKDQWGSGLKIRPEVRYDYSDNSFGVFFGHHDQLTFAVDVIYAF